MIRKGFKFRIYPNNEQEEFLNKHFGATRFIYNYSLDLKIKTYQKDKKSISYFDITKLLPKLKKKYEWLKEINSQSLQMSIRNLDNAFTKFFKEKKGFPKFKSRKSNHHTFQCPQNYKIENNKLYIPKFNKGIKIKQHRDFEGKMKTLTISKTPTNKYYAIILVETTDNIIKPKKLKQNKTIGIDLGLKDFCVISNEEKIENPKHLKQSERRLKIRQRRLSKKQKDSNNRIKYRYNIAKIHEKISFQRQNFLHQLSSKLIRENQSICIEDLNVKGMVQNHNLAKHIQDVGWGEFRRQLEYKSLWSGINLIVIGRFEPSSQICNNCGYRNHELNLSQRTWICPECKIKLDRDINASKNIKDLGIETYRRNYGNSRLSDMNLVTDSGQETSFFREK
jgi:putative transposase